MDSSTLGIIVVVALLGIWLFNGVQADMPPTDPQAYQTYLLRKQIKRNGFGRTILRGLVCLFYGYWSCSLRADFWWEGTNISRVYLAIDIVVISW